jgi:transglutaminase-like putative cysteine protease
MIIDVDVDLQYEAPAAATILLQIEAAAVPGQIIQHAHIDLPSGINFTRVAAEDRVGYRIWMEVSGEFACRYRSRIEAVRPDVALERLAATTLAKLPSGVVRYLMPSRNCPSDRFLPFANSEFGHLRDGEKVVAIRNWVSSNVTYTPGTSSSATTAVDTFLERRGVCRDFAHLFIVLARASGIPARYASVYATGVQPQDFHAVAQVYLSGEWHLIDPAGMSRPDSTAIIGVGQDSVDVSLVTSFGAITLCRQTVQVSLA